MSRRGFVLVMLAVVLWSGNFVFVRAAVDVVPPMALSFYRWVLASCLAIAVAWPHLRRDWPLIKAGWRSLLLLGMTGIAGNSLFVFYGLKTTTAINALLMNSMSPLLTALITFLYFRERPRLSTMIGLALAICGVVWVVIGGDWHLLRTLRLNSGDLWVLVGVATYAVYMAFLRKVPPMHDLSLNAATFTVGAITLLPFFLFEYAGGARSDWSAPISWITIIYMAVGTSVISYFCFNKAIRLIGATRASSFLLLTPPIGAVIAMMTLGERLTMPHVIGAALIFAGLFLGRR
ncbi:DMT family transporter [Govanella unica]|uniref:DMT family transporter n=1 Tax=Govanella unica TaxID=2975056 RepID=A0A9X3TXD2_9PROT|nr:DMT family transporter [Govania unica]MDA5193496.1 DMT family transporter [Govania unica]